MSDGPFAGMMGGWGDWAWPFMGVIPFLFLALLIITMVLLVRYATGAGSGGGQPPIERRSPGLDALEERYARGEINRDEYLQKKKDILG